MGLAPMRTFRYKIFANIYVKYLELRHRWMKGRLWIYRVEDKGLGIWEVNLD